MEDQHKFLFQFGFEIQKFSVGYFLKEVVENFFGDKFLALNFITENFSLSSKHLFDFDKWVLPKVY